MSRDIDISIIVPVYKVEKYLDQCVCSILRQSIKNIEIILVDDGSPDKCPFICNNYANTDKRVRVIHKKNGGLSSARNAGIKIALGKYIVFVDSDDWISIKMCETLFNIAENSNADMVICAIQNYNDFTEEFPNKHWCHVLPFPKKMEKKSFNYKDLNPYNAVSEDAPVTAWNKIYRKTFIISNNLYFPEGLWYEDNLFYYNALINAKSISFTNERLYYYRINRKGSIQQSILNDDRINDIIPIMKQIRDSFIKKKCYSLLKALNQYMIREFTWRYLQISNSRQYFIKLIEESFNHNFTKKLFKELIRNGINSTELIKMSLKYSKITVIIPSYNNENTIKECVYSVLEQTLNDITIIIVNDCSIDHTNKIIKEIAKQDTRVICINNIENKGPGYSRAIALDLVNSEFIFFLDGDDLLASNNVLETLYNICKLKNISTAGGNILCFYDDIKETIQYQSNEFKKSTLMKYSEYIPHPSWGFTRFLYSHDLIVKNNICFPKSRYYEDPVFFTSYMAIAKEFWTITIPVYLYRQSYITKTLGIIQYKDLFINIYKVMDNLKSVSWNLYYYEYKNYLTFCRGALEYLEFHPEHNDEIYSLCNNVFINLDFTYYSNYFNDSEIFLNLLELDVRNSKMDLSLHTTKPNEMDGIQMRKFYFKNVIKNLLRPFFNLYRRAILKVISPAINEIKNNIISDITAQIIQLQNTILDHNEILYKETKQYFINALTNISNQNYSDQKNILNKIKEYKEENITQICKIHNSNIDMIDMIDKMKWYLETRIWHSEELIIKQIRSDTFFMSYMLNKHYNKTINLNNEHSKIYTSLFYNDNRYGSMRSGYEVLSYIINEYNVKSIADFGCGTGTWLYAAMVLGVKDVIGVDGDYVDRNILLIDANDFLPYDLEKPIYLNRVFDLVISMEVAEHLSEKTSDTFVDSLCTHSNNILFSAAHHGQGGENHINEQTFEYWVNKFYIRGYKHIEIRDMFRDNPKIEIWYRENMGMFIKNDVNIV